MIGRGDYREREQKAVRWGNRDRADRAIDSCRLQLAGKIRAHKKRVDAPSASRAKELARQCNGARLPHCSAHGLQKAGATIAAQNGATEYQLMSIFG
jgi:hypothetical protein